MEPNREQNNLNLENLASNLFGWIPPAYNSLQQTAQKVYNWNIREAGKDVETQTENIDSTGTGTMLRNSMHHQSMPSRDDLNMVVHHSMFSKKTATEPGLRGSTKNQSFPATQERGHDLEAIYSTSLPPMLRSMKIRNTLFPPYPNDIYHKPWYSNPRDKRRRDSQSLFSQFHGGMPQVPVLFKLMGTDPVKNELLFKQFRDMMAQAKHGPSCNSTQADAADTDGELPKFLRDKPMREQDLVHPLRYRDWRSEVPSTSGKVRPSFFFRRMFEYDEEEKPKLPSSNKTPEQTSFQGATPSCVGNLIPNENRSGVSNSQSSNSSNPERVSKRTRSSSRSRSNTSDRESRKKRRSHTSSSSSSSDQESASTSRKCRSSIKRKRHLTNSHSESSNDENSADSRSRSSSVVRKNRRLVRKKRRSPTSDSLTSDENSTDGSRHSSICGKSVSSSNSHRLISNGKGRGSKTPSVKAKVKKSTKKNSGQAKATHKRQSKATKRRKIDPQDYIKKRYGKKSAAPKNIKIKIKKKNICTNCNRPFRKGKK